MKKFLGMLAIMLAFSISAIAQTQWYRSTAYAQARVYNGNYVWGNWESSNMSISINLDTDIITVYSPKTQIYKVYNTYNDGNIYYDNSGGKNLKYYVIDQDGDRGAVRLRIESNGNSQLYIDFNDIAWVYNLVRTS